MREKDIKNKGKYYRIEAYSIRNRLLCLSEGKERERAMKRLQEIKEILKNESSDTERVIMNQIRIINQEIFDNEKLLKKINYALQFKSREELLKKMEDLHKKLSKSRNKLIDLELTIMRFR